MSNTIKRKITLEQLNALIAWKEIFIEDWRSWIIIKYEKEKK